jgi:predicted N-acetyltransferase YhbS
MMINTRPTLETDQPGIEALLDKSFGPDREKKTAYRLREGVAPIAALGRVAFEGDVLRGSIAYWPVHVRLKKDAPLLPALLPALLLGPLAVDPVHRGEGVGIRLMEETLEHATRLGHTLIILVGDLDYYARVGFHQDGAANLRLPGPVDQNRVLIRSLQGDDFGALDGMVESVLGTNRSQQASLLAEERHT